MNNVKYYHIVYGSFNTYVKLENYSQDHSLFLKQLKKEGVDIELISEGQYNKHSEIIKRLFFVNYEHFKSIKELF